MEITENNQKQRYIKKNPSLNLVIYPRSRIDGQLL